MNHDIRCLQMLVNKLKRSVEKVANLLEIVIIDSDLLFKLFILDA